MRPNRDRLLRKGNYILGSFIKPESVDGYINAMNPGDRTDIIGRFPFSVASVHDAVEGARAGGARWRRVGLMERAALVHRFREQVAGASEPLARLISRESGKPLWEARQEVGAALRAVDLFLDDGLGLVAPRLIEDISARADYLPRGVVAVITPYSLPLLQGVTMTVAAVLGGNAVVYKPSKFTPGVGQAIAECWDRSRAPRGVFNLVQGTGGVVGHRLVTHPGIDALLFAGSYASAQDIRAALSERQELPVLLQTGGKGVAIVLDDHAIDRTVYEILVGACLTSGQRHNSTSRVFIHAEAYDRVAAELVRRARRLEVGYGLEGDPLMGPLISENFRNRYRRYGKALEQAGHAPLLPAEAVEVSGGYRGNYVRLALYAIDPRRGLQLDDEPPGPTLLLYRVSGVDEAVKLHNQLAARLCASVFARHDHPGIAELREQLSTGTLNVNRGTVGSSLRLPSMGVGRASNGMPSGLELLRVVTHPRSSLVETRPFDPENLVPGMHWDESNEEAEITGPLELTAE